jgi:hypothetical protein
MKKATSLLLTILLSFSIILQSSALIVPYASSSNEKRIYAK